MSITVNTSHATHELNRDDFCRHFRTCPTSLELSYSDFRHLKNYLSGSNQCGYAPSLVALEPCDLVRASYCFKHRMISSNKQLIAMASLMTEEEKRRVDQQLYIVNVKWKNGASEAICHALYHFSSTGSIWDMDWRVLTMAVGEVDLEDGYTALMFSNHSSLYKTNISFIINEGIILYDEDQVARVIHHYRLHVLQQCVTDLDHSNTVIVMGIMGLGHFLGVDIEPADTIDHMNLGNLLQYTWYGEGDMMRSTDERIREIMRRCTSQELTYLRVLVDAAALHSSSTRLTKLQRALTMNII